MRTKNLLLLITLTIFLFKSIGCNIVAYYEEDILLNQAKQQLNNNELSEAYELTEEALSIDPDNIVAHYYKSKIYKRLDNYIKAYEYILEAERILKEKQKLNDVDNYVKFKVYKTKGEIYIGRLMYEGPHFTEKAIITLKKALEIENIEYDNLFDVYVSLGAIYSTNGNWEKSLYYRKKAHEIEPENIFIIYDLAITFFKLNKFNQGASYFNTITERRTKFNNLVNEGYAIYYLEKGNYEKSLNYLQKVEEPEWIYANYYKVVGDRKKAREYLKKEFDKHIASINTYHGRALAEELNLDLAEYEKRLNNKREEAYSREP